jgi:CelD/BcsL family acetyltransferase involved in cellulose biosynthesis
MMQETQHPQSCRCCTRARSIELCCMHVTFCVACMVNVSFASHAVEAEWARFCHEHSGTRRQTHALCLLLATMWIVGTKP